MHIAGKHLTVDIPWSRSYGQEFSEGYGSGAYATGSFGDWALSGATRCSDDGFLVKLRRDYNAVAESFLVLGFVVDTRS